MLKIIRILFLLINSLVILALLTIHFIVKDTGFNESLLFYMFPLPIIIGIILFISLFIGKKSRKYNLILGGILFIIWLGRSFKIHIPDKISEADIEIVFWNASRDNGLEEVFSDNKGIPDVLVLVESQKNNLEALQSKYPEYYFYKSVRGIYVFSKKALIIESEITSPYNTTIVNFKTGGLNFYAIDVTGSTDVPRAWELKFIDSKIREKSNTIILGDFNVPYESVLFKEIKSDFNHAFNEKGNGFRETWFWNIPLLSIDHIWVSKDLKILKTEKKGTFKSNHNMLKTYIKR